jgi:hypothetical protein
MKSNVLLICNGKSLYDLQNIGKAKFSLEQATKAQRGSRGI